MSYRRKRKGGYRSRVVKMKFQSFFDISTSDSSLQIISVNAGGKEVVKRLAPFFGAYKYYKLGGVSFKLVPASTLPVDPTGLSYEAGESTVDPRDQLTPGMCRITNGEDVLENLTGMSAVKQRELYDNMLLDPRWYKWMLQSGVKRFGKPRYWTVGQLHQDKWPGSLVNYPRIVQTAGGTWCNDGTIIKKTEITHSESGGQDVFSETNSYIDDGSGSRGLFQTGHKGVLGWMPTDGLQFVYGSSKPMIACPPEVELFKILMPCAYKTKYYYRAFVTETVYFKDPIVMNINGYRPIDVFHENVLPNATLPTTETGSLDDMYRYDSGGNDGSY